MWNVRFRLPRRPMQGWERTAGAWGQRLTEDCRIASLSRSLQVRPPRTLESVSQAVLSRSPPLPLTGPRPWQGRVRGAALSFGGWESLGISSGAQRPPRGSKEASSQGVQGWAGARQTQPGPSGERAWMVGATGLSTGSRGDTGLQKPRTPGSSWVPSFAPGPMLWKMSVTWT